jgi:alpha-glucosidase
MKRINREALFSDESEQYRIPLEVNPGDITRVIFRTAKDNVDRVFLISGGSRILMEKFTSNDVFDYYKLDIEVKEEKILYFFEVRTGGERVFYNKQGITNDLQSCYSFGIIPGFFVPDWIKGAVMYQIYVDRFYNGDPSNDVITGEYAYIGKQVERVKDWAQNPKAMDVRSFYGGDLQGILDKLDYLVDLGIEVIYMNPIFVSPSNHKYDCQDYDYIDPHYTIIKEDGGELLPKGELNNQKATKYMKRVVNKENLEASNEFFIHFVEEVHKRGIKILLDGVFNHCGSFNKWLDRERLYEGNGDYEKGAFISEESPYHKFFKFNNEHEWPYNEYYDGWWGHMTLPKLCYETSEELYNYIMRIARKWVSPPYNVDGWRLDVAADLGLSCEFNHHFWKDFRRNVKEANPNAVIYAEHYGDAASWLQGDEWDSVMNYDAFMEPLTWFLTGMEKHSELYREDLLNNDEALLGALRHNIRAFYGQSYMIAMNQLSNHDHSRFLTRTNHKVGRARDLGCEAASENVSKAVFREAVTMQMTWHGAPTIYYGDEAGLCGFTDPDNRRTYPWGNEDQELIQFHKELIRIRKENSACKSGCGVPLLTGKGIFSYGRFNRESQIVTIVNNNSEGMKLKVPVWIAEIPDGVLMERLILSIEDGFSVVCAHYLIENGMLEIFMPAYSAAVLRNTMQGNVDRRVTELKRGE